LLCLVMRTASPGAPMFRITVFNTTRRNKRKRCLGGSLGESPGIRPEDVFVNVLDAAKENWSVGHGLAQFA